MGNCLSQAQLEGRKREQGGGRQQGGGRKRGGSGISNRPRVAQQTKEEPKCQGNCFVPCIVCSLGSGGGRKGMKDNQGDNDRENKNADSEDESDLDDDYDSPQDEDEIESDMDDDVNIDDGLLDDVFEELPGNDENQSSKPTRRPPTNRKSPRKSPSKDDCPTCGGSYYCLMGGSNENGPISSVSVMDIGTYSTPSTPLISPFPSFMTQGNGGTFSMYAGNSLHTCTPGYRVSTFVGPYFHDQQIQSSFVPGSCNGYDFGTRRWTSTGGRMTAFRNGGSTVNVGSYIMSFGGFDPFGQSISSVELFDPRRSHIGWHDVPQWSFPQATRDQCTVVTKDPKLGTQVMVMGGLGEEHSVMKLVLNTNNWFSVPPMNYPRSQHGCNSVTLNGRPGVVVSGGVDTNRFNTSSVEFFDMRTHKWINLPSLSRGRRGHTMTTIDGKLAVAGGASTGLKGEEEFLDDVEVFDGRRWKRANYRMDQPRNGANLVKIPIRNFFG